MRQRVTAGVAVLALIGLVFALNFYQLSVVDARLRVHGVPGLRIVDASVFPSVTSGNTNTPTTMVAEKASDLIKEEEGG